MFRIAADQQRTIDLDDEVNVNQYNTSNMKMRNQDTQMEVELVENPYDNIANYVLDGHVQKQQNQNVNLDSIDTDANVNVKNSHRVEERKGNNQTVLGSEKSQKEF